MILRMSGQRQVALTLGTKTLLEVWVPTLDTGSDSDWLFPSENGTPIRRENLWPRYILRKLEPANLAWATFQVMRRSFATWAKKAGGDLKPSLSTKQATSEPLTQPR